MTAAWHQHHDPAEYPLSCVDCKAEQGGLHADPVAVSPLAPLATGTCSHGLTVRYNLALDVFRHEDFTRCDGDLVHEEVRRYGHVAFTVPDISSDNLRAALGGTVTTEGTEGSFITGPDHVRTFRFGRWWRAPYGTQLPVPGAPMPVAWLAEGTSDYPDSLWEAAHHDRHTRNERSSTCTACKAYWQRKEGAAPDRPWSDSEGVPPRDGHVTLPPLSAGTSIRLMDVEERLDALETSVRDLNTVVAGLVTTPDDDAAETPSEPCGRMLAEGHCPDHEHPQAALWLRAWNAGQQASDAPAVDLERMEHAERVVEAARHLTDRWQDMDGPELDRRLDNLRTLVDGFDEHHPVKP